MPNVTHTNNEGFEYININPQHRLDSTDCAVRAIAMAFGASWEDALCDLVQSSVKTGYMPDQFENVKHCLERNNARKVKTPELMTINQFLEENSCGAFLIFINFEDFLHLTYAKDGKLYDNYNYLYYQIEDIFEVKENK